METLRSDFDRMDNPFGLLTGEIRSFGITVVDSTELFFVNANGCGCLKLPSKSQKLIGKNFITPNPLFYMMILISILTSTCQRVVRI